MNEIQQLTETQKAAAILIALGKDRASRLLTHFQPDEVRALLVASKKIEGVSKDLFADLVEQFEQELSERSGIIDTSSEMRAIIEEALTPEEVAELGDSDNEADLQLGGRTIWEVIEDVEDDELLKFLTNENTQASAYVLSKLSSKKSANLISRLEGDDRNQILSSMIASREASPLAVEMLESLLRESFGRSSGGEDAVNGQRRVASIFNELDQELSDGLFDELAGAVHEKKLKSLKSMMFRFEDVGSLDSTELSNLFDQMPTEIVTMALREVAPELKELILGSVGQRTRRMMEAELGTPSSADPADIKAAQKQIASTVLELSSAGRIKLPEPDIAA
ncbi:MAG: FliG C-terminal domain-containing protein [Rhizobiaceae bacterium]